jgi:Flp pilus assembly protein TadG
MAVIRRQSEGQALIEFALILPLLFLLIVNVVNFGGFFYSWITVSNSARTGAQYLVIGGAMYSAPTAPTFARVQSFVLADLNALPNSASAQVTVCSRNPSSSAAVASVTCVGPGTFAPPVDSNTEAGSFVIGSVDVVYTYQPFIPLWDFPRIGIHATLPPTRIHRQAAMRMYI